MATSPWSAALRSTPGYVTGAAPTTTPAPTFTAPSLPTLPAIDDARAPNAAGRAWLGTQLGNLPGKYNPLIDAARANARYALAGYGGVTINDNNTVTFDPNAPLGQKERQAVTGAKNQANAQGLLFSSFANQAIGNVLTQLTEDKRNIAMQFSSSVNNILQQESSEGASLVGQLVGLYGQDAQWLAENPPPNPTTIPANSNPYNGSPYDAGTIEAAAAPYIAWAGTSAIAPPPPGTPNPLTGVTVPGTWGKAPTPVAKPKVKIPGPGAYTGVGAWGRK